MRPVLSVRLFGKLCVEYQARVVPNLTARKVQELLCYLLLYRDRPHPRETLASVLWDDATTAQARTYLRKALWQLQHTLKPALQHPQCHAFLITPEWVQVHPQADIWLDVAVFEQACTGVEGVSAAQLDGHTAALLQQAVTLYQSDLLEGWYHDWCLYERERLQNLYLSLLDKLMDYCERHHDYAGGLTYGTQSLRYDRAREQTHQRMMRLYALAGDRAAARRQFERCVAALDEALGVQPMPCTLHLCEQIMANQLGSEAVPPPHPAPASATMAPMTDVLEQLTRLQHTLAELQQCLQHVMHLVEPMLPQHAALSPLETKKNAMGYAAATLQDTYPVYAASRNAIASTANLHIGRPYAELGG